MLAKNRRVPTPASPSGSIATPIALIIGSCVSLQFGAALAVQLFPELGSWGVTALRLSIAAVILLLAGRPRFLAWSRRQWFAVVGFGLSLGAMNGFFYAALEHLPLGPAVAIEFVGPLVLSAVLSRRLVDMAWVGLAVAGIALFGLDGVLGSEPLSPIGVALVLVAAAFWVCYIRTSARVGGLIPGVGGLAVALSIASIALLPFGVPAAMELALRPELVWLAVGTAVFASVAPYTLELVALRRLPQRVFGVLISLEPVFAALFGWLLLQQAIGPLKIAAIALVAGASVGIALASRGKADPPPVAVTTGSVPVIGETPHRATR